MNPIYPLNAADWDATFPPEQQALAIREEVLGPKHPRTAASYDSLAANLEDQGKSRDAEVYWRAAVEALEAARLHLAGAGMDRAAATRIAPHRGGITASRWG